MSSLSELTSIFEERKNATKLPLTLGMDPSTMRERLNEQVRFERIVSYSINTPDSDNIYLEPIPHEISRIYRTQEDEDMEDAQNEDELTLLPIGSLGLFGDSDALMITEAPPSININDYKTRWQAAMDIIQNKNAPETSEPEVQIISVEEQPVTTTTSTEEQTTQTTTSHSEVQVVVTEQQTTVVTTTTTENQTTQTTALPSEENQVSRADTSPQAVDSQDQAPETFNAKLYDASNIDTDNTSTGTKIYAYPEYFIPAFPTQSQQMECDSIAKDAVASFFHMNLTTSLETLGLGTTEELESSGKSLFIRKLLQKMENVDKTILFSTPDINDEVILLEQFKKMGLACERISNVLDEVWDGEYGAYVKTMKRSSKSYTLEFDAVDFIIHMDVTVGNNIQDKLQSPKPPVAWLIALGSIEQRVFNYLRLNKVSFAEAKNNDRFKDLLNVPNRWPPSTPEFLQKNTDIIAANIRGWLEMPTKSTYQFRSEVQLFHSYLFGTLKKSNIVGVIEVTEVEDMDISSSDEDDKMDDILYTYEITCNPATKPTQDIDAPHKEIVTEYEKEAELLKARFAKEFSELREKYKAKLKQ